MILKKNFPWFPAHWRLLKATYFHIKIVNFYDAPQDTCIIHLESEHISVRFERVYVNETTYVDSIEIDYYFYEVLPGFDLDCSYMKHDLTLVFVGEDMVSEVIIDDRNYEYGALKKICSDVPIVLQIRLAILKKIQLAHRINL